MSSEPQQPQQMPQRNERGQFVPGHNGGPGRPPASRETTYLRLLRQSVPPQEFAAAAAAVLSIALDPAAKASDRIRAFSALAEHCLPTQRDRYGLEISLADPAEASEFRIAGATVGEIDKYAAERIRMLLIEQVQYEKALEQQGLLPRRSNNGDQQ